MAILVAGGSFAAASLQEPRRALVVTPPSQAGALDGARLDPIGGVGGLEGSPSLDSLARIDRAIGTWAGNVEREARDFISATNLALLYEARARLTGDVGDHQRARLATDRALAAEPSYRPARVLRAKVAFSLHDFTTAMSVADALVAEDPGLHEALAIAGDTRLETGDLSAAADAYQRLHRDRPGAPVTARLARLAFIEGRPADASALAAQAIREARSAGERGPSLGWYQLLAGSLAFARGRLDEAERHLREAERQWPNAPAILLARARLAAAADRPQDAVALLERATRIVPLPESLALVGDLYALMGNAAAAERQYATVDLIGRLASAERRPYDRQLVLFRADHGRDVEAAVAMARAELDVRHDAYGYDAYAWALHAAGRSSDALEPMRRALAVGVRDARLAYHAGMIELAAGERQAGIAHLEDALQLNPGFDPLGATRARAALECVRLRPLDETCGRLPIGGN